MHNTENIFAGFMQMYYYSNPDAAHRFLTKCRSYSGQQANIG